MHLHKKTKKLKSLSYKGFQLFLLRLYWLCFLLKATVAIFLKRKLLFIPSFLIKYLPQAPQAPSTSSSATNFVARGRYLPLSQRWFWL